MSFWLIHSSSFYCVAYYCVTFTVLHSINIENTHMNESHTHPIMESIHYFYYSICSDVTNDVHTWKVTSFHAIVYTHRDAYAHPLIRAKWLALEEDISILFLGLWSLIHTHALNGEYYHRMAGSGYIVYCTVCFSSRWVKFPNIFTF